MEKLYGYKMSHDDRFAPNPYHEDLTLATCKPYLRLNAEVDDWMAGYSDRYPAKRPGKDKETLAGDYQSISQKVFYH